MTGKFTSIDATEKAMNYYDMLILRQPREAEPEDLIDINQLHDAKAGAYWNRRKIFE
jgi:hypothetical protein